MSQISLLKTWLATVNSVKTDKQGHMTERHVTGRRVDTQSRGDHCATSGSRQIYFWVVFTKRLNVPPLHIMTSTHTYKSRRKPGLKKQLSPLKYQWHTYRTGRQPVKLQYHGNADITHTIVRP